jgi:hypothetical protein
LERKNSLDAECFCVHSAVQESLSERQESGNDILRKEGEIDISAATLAQRLGM